MRHILLTAASSIALVLSACQSDIKTTPVSSTPDVTVTEVPQAPKAPTLQDAKEFIEASEKEIEEKGEYMARVEWIKANFITHDSNWLSEKAGAEALKLSTRLSSEATHFDGLSLPADMARKMDMLKRGSNFPAPDIEGAADKLSGIMTRLDSAYGTGEFEHNGETISLYEASDIIAKSRDPEELAKIWAGWRTISPDMRGDYAEMVKIINQGAAELGYKDVGALWRSGYDMEPDAFTAEVDRLWTQVKPLYDELHCHVRAKLNENYGDEIVPLDEPIRADLLGNMWGQQWGGIYDLVAPENAVAGVDLTALLKDKEYTPIKMVETAEGFFTSLGFDPLPQTFWDRSLFTKPADRDVVCHASAWNLDNLDDIRIKMCTKVNGEDFLTVHHELGHSFYQRAYKDKSIIYRDGAHDGFHEAIGDMISLSITPDYLVNIGLLDAENKPSEDAEISLLMQQALDKVAFLPFGLLVDQWRWKVFNGDYSPAEYNDGWWELREKYQGLKPPVERGANDFDPGAKYHIPGNTPYMRYFLSFVMQFQFHKAACDMAGYEGPLHNCSIYGDKKVGKHFGAMLEMGSSKPWPDALEAFTGTREMDGSAILEYFDPLMVYLKDQNKDRKCGW